MAEPSIARDCSRMLVAGDYAVAVGQTLCHFTYRARRHPKYRGNIAGLTT